MLYLAEYGGGEMNYTEYLKKLVQYEEIIEQIDRIDPELFDIHGVKKGLRDKNGNGVIAGLTNISKIESFKFENDKKIPIEGRLWYRGYEVIDLINDFSFKRSGFEEVTYLLLFGKLPNNNELSMFQEMIANARELPTNFTRDVIMKAPSQDIMNSMMKSVLTLAAYDSNPNDTSIENVLRQCIFLIGVFPRLAIYGYHAYNHYEKNESMYIHYPDKNLSTAENILMMLRPDKKYTQLEVCVLDVALVLHMEHGGGNNSTFTTRVVSSSGSDTYSVVAASLASLKGPKHGGANIKVIEMIQDIKKHVSNPENEQELKEYLGKIVDKQAFDQTGLIYGMGHAVYSISDPRARVFKRFVSQLAKEKELEQEFKLYNSIEKLAPEVIAEKKHIYKGVSANVDFYSGFVYSMLGLPIELYTPMFAIARIVGWSAHRIEELINVDKIIRPAYKSIAEEKEFIPMEKRK